jgi:hypothetical protein
MSEQTAEATAMEAPAENTEQVKPTETVEFWREQAKKQEKRAKENADAAKRLAQIEEANKTEAQKAADRVAAAEQAASEARNEALRYKIATEFKLSEDDAKALEHVGSEDGMRLVAERLAARTDEQKKNGNHVPREGNNPKPGEDGMRAFTRNLFRPGE